MSPIQNQNTISVWEENITMPVFTPLTRDFHTDVCIVGGGIAGLTSAYLLTKEGKRVCLLEDSELCSGQTGRTTAHFTSSLDYRYFELEKYHGHEGARVAAESHSTAIEKVIEIIKSEKIECDMDILDGYLFAAGDNRKNILLKELVSTHRAGLKNVEWVEYSPLNFFKSGPALKFPRQMQLHPLKYLNKLIHCIAKGSGDIFTNTHVVEVKGGKQAYVKTKDGHTVYCDSIIVATNTPINDLVVVHTKQAAYRTYVLAFKIPKDSMMSALYWDTLDPYHYIRIEKDHLQYDTLIVGGEDHKTGQDDNPELRFSHLEKWARRRFPMIQEILTRWSGQVMQSVDGLGYNGRNPLDRDNVYVITGDTGNGMTNSTIGALLVTDLIMNRENPWEKVYDPARINIHSASIYLKENANTAAQYKEWLEPKPRPDLKRMPADMGVVYRHGLTLYAAHKDEKGNMQFNSAVCPHLGGVVHWNNVEKSWDCPCHGSRFSADGKVIEGPAKSDLEKIHFDELVPEPENKDESKFYARDEATGLSYEGQGYNQAHAEKEKMTWSKGLDQNV